MEPAKAREALESPSKLQVTPTDADLVVKAAETSVNHQLSIWDAMVIEAAVIAGCQVLLSEELNDGQVIRGVQIQNPFTP